MGSTGPRILACLRTMVSGPLVSDGLVQPSSARRHAARRPWIVDVAFLARELLQREDRPPVRLLVDGEHLLLLLRHGDDQVRLRDQLAVAPQIRGRDLVLAQMDPVLA